MMVGRLEKALPTRKGVAIALFLDIHSVLDNVNVNYSSNALLELGFDPMMVRWYTNYLGNRITTATVPGVSLQRPFVWNANVDRLLALFDMFDPPTEDEDLEAWDQRGTSFYDLG